MYDPSGLYVDPILSSMSVGYQPQTLIGEKLFPITEVNTPSGRYRVYDRSHWLIYPDRREPGTVANEVEGRKWSEDTFKTQEHSLQAPVFWEERQFYQSIGGLSADFNGGDLDLDPERDALDTIWTSILLRHEKLVADTIRNTANYAGNHTVTLAGAQRWNDYTGGTSSTSDPVANIKAAVMRIYLDTGRWPNTVVFPIDAIGVVEGHPRVVDRFKNFALTDPEAWKKLLNVPAPANFYIADSKYNAAQNIDAAESITSLWGQDVWIGIVDPTVGQKTKTFGRTFVFPYAGLGARPTEKWTEPSRKADIVRGNWRYDQKIVSAAAGYLIKTAVDALT
jgi:hypothetical protein